MEDKINTLNLSTSAMRPVYILELQVHTTHTKNLSDGTNHPMGLAFLRVLFKVERPCGKRIQDIDTFPWQASFLSGSRPVVGYRGTCGFVPPRLLAFY